ncbi:hypothetical protein BMS3Abin17_01048 [archaeon BMS3Abin17]|nr:hypothetical protein BMS3Abin17_01048 [archaeon BMS3Abin17]HDZ60732.1 hypothetical protein [Candidatus Pacearchaeota archaeon]
MVEKVCAYNYIILVAEDGTLTRKGKGRTLEHKTYLLGCKKEEKVTQCISPNSPKLAENCEKLADKRNWGKNQEEEVLDKEITYSNPLTIFCGRQELLRIETAKRGEVKRVPYYIDEGELPGGYVSCKGRQRSPHPQDKCGFRIEDIGRSSEDKRRIIARIPGAVCYDVSLIS